MFPNLFELFAVTLIFLQSGIGVENKRLAIDAIKHCTQNSLVSEPFQADDWY